MNQNDINKNSYNQIVKEWSDYRKECKINNCIKDFCRFLPYGAHILDIGCGTGYPIDDYLVKNGFSVVGIDASDKMIDEARKLDLPHALFLNEEFLSYNCDIKYDAVIAFDSIWHIDETNQRQIYKKTASLLKENGFFLFTHGKSKGTVFGKMFSNDFIYSALDKKEVKTLLSESDLKIIEWHENYSEQTTGTRDLLVVAKKV